MVLIWNRKGTIRTFLPNQNWRCFLHHEDFSHFLGWKLQSQFLGWKNALTLHLIGSDGFPFHKDSKYGPNSKNMKSTKSTFLQTTAALVLFWRPLWFYCQQEKQTKALIDSIGRPLVLLLPAFLQAKQVFDCHLLYSILSKFCLLASSSCSPCAPLVSLLLAFLFPPSGETGFWSYPTKILSSSLLFLFSEFVHLALLLAFLLPPSGKTGFLQILCRPFGLPSLGVFEKSKRWLTNFEESFL